MSVEFSFDIGHSSIGWAAVSPGAGELEILGCGSVIFRPDDCQNHDRATKRRQRRNIAATRNRIKRLGKLFVHVGAFSSEELDARMSQGAGHPFPWLLAANILTGAREQLTWLEIWDVIRWYAHNRGYDGNARWSKSEVEQKDDAKKVTAARKLMATHKIAGESDEIPMAITVCRFLKVDPTYLGNSPLRLDEDQKTPYFKGEGVAFPRNVVVGEILSILKHHRDKLEGLDDSFIECLCGDEKNSWKAIPSLVDKINTQGIYLPKRYYGGLLFGQMLPRFHNRIIPTCRFVSSQYTVCHKETAIECAIRRKESGQSKTARIEKEKTFDKLLKTPSKHCPEFYRFRWGMLLCNLRVDEGLGVVRPLSVKERNMVHERMVEAGSFAGDVKKGTNGKFTKMLEADFGLTLKNPDIFLTPEMEKALVLNPVKSFLNLRWVKILFQALPEKQQAHFSTRLFNQRYSSIQYLESVIGKLKSAALMANFAENIQQAFEAYNKSHKKKPIEFNEFVSMDLTLRSELTKNFASGRAPYSKQIMKEAWRVVMEGGDPRALDPVSGKYGCLVETPETTAKKLKKLNINIPKGLPVDSKQYRRAEEKQIASLTNNSLVRHRLLIFRRLLRDLIKNYANSDVVQVGGITFERIGDLQEYSGMTSQDIKKYEGARIREFNDSVSEIEKAADAIGYSGKIGPKHFKMARIARDLGMRCPYTECNPYKFADILQDKLVFEHIIPRSKRPSDSLESLALTWPEINDLKGNLTGMEFIEKFHGRQIVTANGSFPVRNPESYRKFIELLQPKGDPRKNKTTPDGKKKYIGDDLRRWKRKQLFQVEHFDKRKDKGFTGADLTQSSHLNKLAELQAEALGIPRSRIMSLPAQVSVTLRSSWNLYSCLTLGCPSIKGFEHNKQKIREHTHLHHAIDAVNAALAAYLFPQKDGKLWELLAQRKLNQKQGFELLRVLSMRGIDAKIIDGRLNLVLPQEIWNQVARCLGERRVVMHMPKAMRGLSTDENAFGLINIDEEQFVVRGRKRDEKTKRRLIKKPKKPFTVNNSFGVIRASDGLPKTSEKLGDSKSVYLLTENYGVVMFENDSVIIPYVKVRKTLNKLIAARPGEAFQILRTHHMIQIPDDARELQGKWHILSVKKNSNQSSPAVDMCRSDQVKTKQKYKDEDGKEKTKILEGFKQNIEIDRLRALGFRIISSDLTGNV